MVLLLTTAVAPRRCAGRECPASKSNSERTSTDGQHPPALPAHILHTSHALSSPSSRSPHYCTADTASMAGMGEHVNAYGYQTSLCQSWCAIGCHTPVISYQHIIGVCVLHLPGWGSCAVRWGGGVCQALCGAQRRILKGIA